MGATIVVLWIASVVVAAQLAKDPAQGTTGQQESGSSDESRDVLPDGISVADKGYDEAMGPEGDSIYSMGVVLENSTDSPMAMHVSYVLGSEADSEPLRAPEESSTPAFITVPPNGSAGAGDQLTVESGDADVDYLGIIASAVDSDGQPVGLDALAAKHSDLSMSAEVVDYQRSNPASLDITVTNDYPEAVESAGLGVVFEVSGKIVGGWTHRPNSDDPQPGSGMAKGTDEVYEPGESSHAIHIPIPDSVEETSQVQVYIWP